MYCHVFYESVYNLKIVWRWWRSSPSNTVHRQMVKFLGDRLLNGSPYASGLLSICPVLSVCPVCNMVGLGRGHILLDGDAAPPPPKGHAPNFRPISVAAKWLYRSRCHLVWRYTHPLSRQIVNLQTSTKVSSLPVRFCRLVTQCQRLRFVLRFWRYIN